MAKRRRLERFTETELDELLNAPATRGLDKVLRAFETRPVLVPDSVAAPNRAPDTSPLTSPGDVSTPGDPMAPAVDQTSPLTSSPADRHGDRVASPGDVLSPGAIAASGDTSTPDDVTASGSILPINSSNRPPSSLVPKFGLGIATPGDVSTPGGPLSPDGEASSPAWPTTGGSVPTSPGDVLSPADSPTSAPASQTSKRAVIAPHPSAATTPGDVPTTGDLTPKIASTRRLPVEFTRQRRIPAPQFLFRDREGNIVENRRVQKCSLVQHGHSPTEQLLYQILWSLGSRSEDKAPYREVQIGYDRLANQSGITKRNIIEIMHRLREKLAIDIVQEQDSSRNLARVYRVYSMTQVLERRRNAGLEYVVRHKGVDFVVPEYDEPTPDAATSPGDVSSPGAAPSSGATPAPGALESTEPVDVSSLRPGDASSPALGKNQRHPTGTSSAPVSVVHALNAVCHVDDAAVRTIVAQCRRRVPDATDEEIAWFSSVTGNRIRTMRNVENAVGLLITQVPKCFEGETFRQFREAERQRSAMEAQRTELMRREWERVVSDPASTEEEKEFARSMLDTASPG